MALFKPFRGSRASLSTQELHDGYAYFCTDDGSFHIDYLDSDGNLKRKQINGKEAEMLTGYSISTLLNSNDTEIPTSQAVFVAIEGTIEEYKKVVDSRVDTIESKLYTIENGAQVNILESIKLNGAAQVIDNKSVNIPIATNTILGIVLSSSADNKVSVLNDGTMEVNSINVNKLVQTDGDTLVLNGGSSSI